MFERILFATDGSEIAQRAAEHALELADRYGAELVVVSVIEQRYLYAGPPATGEVWEEISDRARQRAREHTDPVVEQARARNVPVAVRIVEEDSAAESILDVAEAEHVDAIVLGTHGRSGVKRFLLGSVAERVVRHAGVPVLVVPARAVEGDDGAGDG